MRRRIDRTGQKKCERCKKWLNLNDFMEKPSNKDGRAGVCTKCYSGSNKAVFGVESSYGSERKAQAYANVKKINDEAVEAYKCGMSYGKWKALQMMEKQKRDKVQCE